MFLSLQLSATLLVIAEVVAASASSSSSLSVAAANDFGFAVPETSREYCQLETFSPRCPSHNDVIVIKSATFGRMRVGRCIDADSLTDHLRDTLGCQADVVDYVSRQCSGKTLCDIAVPNRELLSSRPCSNQLTMYLEASYSCLSVVEEDRSCTVTVTSGLHQHIRSSSENSDSGRQRVRCGSLSHPWLLEAQTGQLVNISLLDFSGHGRRTQLDTRGLVSDDCSPAHVQYGYIVDKTNKNNVSICSTDAQQRHKHVYQSAGNLIEVVLMHAELVKSGNSFLLAVEAVGCSNLVPPSDAWLRRTDNEATIGCYTSRQRWNLRCDGNQWKGTVGVCSSNDVTFQIHSDDLNPSAVESAESDDTFVEVLLIVAISFVGLAVCLIIIFVGIGCARKYKVASHLSVKHSANDDFHTVKSLERPLFYADNMSHSAVIRDDIVQP